MRRKLSRIQTIASKSKRKTLSWRVLTASPNAVALYKAFLYNSDEACLPIQQWISQLVCKTKQKKKQKAREKVNCSLLKAVNLQPWLPIFSSYINGLMGDGERLEPDIFKICQELAFQKGSQNLNLALVLQVISTNVPI